MAASPSMGVAALAQVVTHLTEENRRLKEENDALRAQLGGDGAVYVMSKMNVMHHTHDIFNGRTKVCFTLEEVYATIEAFGSNFPDKARAQRMVDYARQHVTADKTTSDVWLPESVGPNMYVCSVTRYSRV